jgi:hypothetical protein
MAVLHNNLCSSSSSNNRQQQQQAEGYNITQQQHTQKQLLCVATSEGCHAWNKGTASADII